MASDLVGREKEDAQAMIPLLPGCSVEGKLDGESTFEAANRNLY